MLQNPTLQQLDDIRESGFRPGIIACFINDKKLLFVFKEEYSLWVLPQAGIENGETIKDSLVKRIGEELEVNFVNNSDLNPVIFGEDQITFPPSKQEEGKLKMDDGTPMNMVGKRFFFIHVSTKNRFLEIEKTDYDQYCWLNYEEAIDLAQTISQKGKKRVTLNIIEELKKLNVID